MYETILVYSSEGINELKSDFAERGFVGFGFFLNVAHNVEEIENLDDGYDNFIVDLTTLAFDNTYYKIFLERYLYALKNKFSNMEFIVINEQKENLLARFPHIFADVDEKYNITSNDGVPLQTQVNSTEIKYVDFVPLSLYRKTLLESYIEKYNIVSIGSLFNGAENLSYSFNTSTILSALETENIQYIDITPIVELFKLRSDLILTFDILLRQFLSLKESIIFLISDEKIDEIKKYLPFTFKINTTTFDSSVNGNEVIEPKLSNEQVDIIIGELKKSLKGHEKFKQDFEFNLKKYIFLNELGERKVLSIFLTGESGVGKTEFAKMLSEAMYPTQELIKINFGNYSNEGVLNSLIGSPLGYIGSEEGGELINKMKISKSKIILIDEFEKATSSVFHFFYELLEDGKFTDRHGVEHNLNGYIIIFTSNMSKKRYIESVPDPLKSRFDLVYRFMELPPDEKIRYILETASKLIDVIFENTGVKVEIKCIEDEMNNLIKNSNLRSIKRNIEDIVIAQYYAML